MLRSGMETISQREMRNRSGEYLRRTAAGESFVVTNNGVVVACLIPPSAHRSGLDDAAARGQIRAATASASTLRTIKRAKSKLSSAEILTDSRGRW